MGVKRIEELKQPVSDQMKTVAAELRNIANEIDRGEITEIVVIGRSKEPEHHYFDIDSFEDCWRLIAAIEFAKYKVMKSHLADD